MTWSLSTRLDSVPAVTGIPYHDFDSALAWLATSTAPDVGPKLQNILQQHQITYRLENQTCESIVEPSIAFAEKTTPRLTGRGPLPANPSLHIRW